MGEILFFFPILLNRKRENIALKNFSFISNTLMRNIKAEIGVETLLLRNIEIWTMRPYKTDFTHSNYILHFKHLFVRSGKVIFRRIFQCWWFGRVFDSFQMIIPGCLRGDICFKRAQFDKTRVKYQKVKDHINAELRPRAQKLNKGAKIRVRVNWWCAKY